MKTIPIGQLLVDENIITAEQLASALEEQKKTRKRIGEVIADLGYASERDILRTLAQRLGVEYVDSPLFIVELDTVKLISEQFHFCPFLILTISHVFTSIRFSMSFIAFSPTPLV